MSFNFNGIPGAEVQIQGISPTASDYANLKSVHQASGAATLVYTVPVGKIAVIVSASAAAGLAGADSNVNARPGGIVNYLAYSKSTALTADHWTGNFKLVAGETIYITGQGTVSFYELTV